MWNGLLAYYKLLAYCACGLPGITLHANYAVLSWLFPDLISFVLKPSCTLRLWLLFIFWLFFYISHMERKAQQKCFIRTKFCSHSPRNCWNFWDIRSWALPTALRTFPSTAERKKHKWQHTWIHGFFHGFLSQRHPVCYKWQNLIIFAIVWTHGTQQDTISKRNHFSSVLHSSYLMQTKN